MSNKPNSRLKSYSEFKLNEQDDNSLTRLTGYFDKVQDKIKGILQSEKNKSEDEADKFMQDMFTSDSKRMKRLKKEVSEYSYKGLSSKQCARIIMNTYYKITKVNKYNGGMDNPEEITEITESVSTTKIKQLSESLLIIFIKHMTHLKTNFIFDNTGISHIDNTLNSEGYLMYMETPNMKFKDIENEFMYSRSLNNIVKSIEENKYKNDSVKLYLAINLKSKLEFGYIIGDNKISYGEIKFNNRTISKLINIVDVKNDDIDLNRTFMKLKSTLRKTFTYKQLLKAELSNYNTVQDKNSVYIYTSVVNDNITLVVDSNGNDDVISINSITNILKNNDTYRIKDGEYTIVDKKVGRKTFYYINL